MFLCIQRSKLAAWHATPFQSVIQSLTTEAQHYSGFMRRARAIYTQQTTHTHTPKPQHKQSKFNFTQHSRFKFVSRLFEFQRRFEAASTIYLLTGVPEPSLNPDPKMWEILTQISAQVLRAWIYSGLQLQFILIWQYRYGNNNKFII